MPSRDAIFLELNQRFVPHALIFLKSLERRFPEHPDVFLYTFGVDERSLLKFSRFPRVKTVVSSFDDFVWGPPMASHHPNFADARISYARFLIWGPAFDGYRNVLHLDTDILALKPFDELLSRVDFTMFADVCEGEDALFYDRKDPELLRLLDEDGITPPKRMANAGVFLVPRKDRTPEDGRLLEYLLRRYERFIRWSDQSVLNLWMAKKGYAPVLDARFNFQHPLLERPDGPRRVASDVRVFHLSGIDMSYKLFFMRLAAACGRSAFNLGVYRAVYLAARRLLKGWRALKKNCKMQKT